MTADYEDSETAGLLLSATSFTSSGKALTAAPSLAEKTPGRQEPQESSAAAEKAPVRRYYFYDDYDPHSSPRYADYSGDVDPATGQWHGLGTVRWDDGDVYEGTFEDDEYHGRGRYTHCCHGEDGAREEVYEGEFFRGERHGLGKITYADGDVYEGQFREGLPDGQGTYRRSNDGDVYEGEIMDGLRHGRGICRYANGDEYEGEWREDREEGHGTYRFANGESYEGEWKGGKREGGGTHRLHDGTIQYEGEYVNDIPHGRGRLKLEDGTEYEGELQEGRGEGHGTMRYPNGDVYEGIFLDGKPGGGLGVYRPADGGGGDSNSLEAYQGKFLAIDRRSSLLFQYVSMLVFLIVDFITRVFLSPLSLFRTSGPSAAAIAVIAVGGHDEPNARR